MGSELQLAITADLHWGHRARRRTPRACSPRSCDAEPPDVLVLAGDIGTGDVLRRLPATLRRPALPQGAGARQSRPLGAADDADARLAPALPEAPAAMRPRVRLPLPRSTGRCCCPKPDLALVGSINWYDYSWSLDGMRRDYPGEEERLRSKRFTRGRHNDANFVRWPLDDVALHGAGGGYAASSSCATALAQVGQVDRRDASSAVPRPELPAAAAAVDARTACCGTPSAAIGRWRRCWRATPSGSPSPSAATRTGRARARWHGIRGYNVGGDYHFKRLLWLDWPAGTVSAHQFGDAER